MEFEFRDHILMEKISHTPYASLLLHLKFVVSVSVTVSAETIAKLEFRFQYWTETKIAVSFILSRCSKANYFMLAYPLMPF